MLLCVCVCLCFVEQQNGVLRFFVGNHFSANVHISVIDINEYSPTFLEPSYVTEVHAEAGVKTHPPTHTHITLFSTGFFFVVVVFRWTKDDCIRK